MLVFKTEHFLNTIKSTVTEQDNIVENLNHYFEVINNAETKVVLTIEVSSN